MIAVDAGIEQPLRIAFTSCVTAELADDGGRDTEPLKSDGDIAASLQRSIGTSKPKPMTDSPTEGRRSTHTLMPPPILLSTTAAFLFMMRPPEYSALILVRKIIISGRDSG